MRHIIRLIGLLGLLLACGCSDGRLEDVAVEKPAVEKTVAVVLPLERGLEVHWRRALSLYASSLRRAYKDMDIEVRLNFELYDELTEDLPALSRSLASRDDIYAVVGGLYSSDAAEMAAALTRVGKTFFTLATSEEVVRAFAPTGCLWAMTETDITQCEVLLSKVINYGGESVALIAREDVYGKTFIDWFAFQARELGIENRGVYTYRSADELQDVAHTAFGCGADYVVCVPSGIEEIGPMLRCHDAIRNRLGERAPRLLFSDTGYGADVLSLYGMEAEGMEGVAFGADPESGFDVSYNVYFGEYPTVGEAQLYDAVMLIGFAAWLQHLHPELYLREALRELVSGDDINMGSWAGEDMSLVAGALAAGDRPRIRGASGPLRFDKKIFTNVLATTYYNYRVYDGAYIILDYNTSDGGNRTDATLAGWNWKASLMQDFEDSGPTAYPEHTGNRALLVAASTGWSNYRHQADVLAIYQELKANGYDDDHIVLIMEDDIAFNGLNPEQGVVRITPGGGNVYRNPEIDYRLSSLSAEDFLAILRGEVSDRLPEVVSSGPNDNVFVFWSGHGVPGAMCWGDEEKGLTASMLAPALEEMASRRSYRKLMMMVEACYSGGVMAECAGLPGMLFVTAANGEETSKADVFSNDLRVWMSNRFTSTFIEMIRENGAVSVRDMYYRLFLNTVGSHVMVYNALNYGNLYSADMSEFIFSRSH